MNTRKILVASLALGLAAAFSPVPQAAAFVSPGSQSATENLAQVVKMKRKGKMAEKMKGHRHHARHRRQHMAMSHGGCKRAYMYHKGGKCMDARNK